MANDLKQWYAIHTYAGYEERVKKNLEQRIKSTDMASEISEVVIPTEEEIEVKNGQRRTITKKIMPGYVLVKMDMNDNSWSVVRNTPAVTGFVGSGNKPVALKDEEVSRILKPQGIFAFTVEEQKWGQADHYPINPVEVAENPKEDVAVLLYRHSAEVIGSALGSSGFTIVKALEFVAFAYPAEQRDVYFKATIARKG